MLANCFRLCYSCLGQAEVDRQLLIVILGTVKDNGFKLDYARIAAQMSDEDTTCTAIAVERHLEKLSNLFDKKKESVLQILRVLDTNAIIESTIPLPNDQRPTTKVHHQANAPNKASRRWKLPRLWKSRTGQGREA